MNANFAKSGAKRGRSSTLRGAATAAAMADKSERSKKILVVDVGGTHVKCASTDHPSLREFASGPNLTAAEMVKQVVNLARRWQYEAVTIGYPSVVADGRPVREPKNLGTGWVGFDFEAAFGRPVRILNDAAMQALGNYAGGKMLFLGLGTGLGSALIVDGVIVPMELAHLQWRKGRDYEYYVGDHGRKRLGERKWRAKVFEVVSDFRNALQPDEIVLGGGNARRLKRLLPNTRLGDTLAAFHGGLRFWDEQAHSRVDAQPADVVDNRKPRRKTRARTPR